VGSITVDSTSLPFFKDIFPSAAAGTYQKGSTTYNSLIDAVRKYADDFVAVVKKYTPADGSLDEQFDRNTGAPRSARDLTWSFAAFLTAIERRDGVVPPGWGEPNANTVPNVCTGTPSCNSRTTFNVRVKTVPGENIYVVGALTQLSNWDPNTAKLLSASRYTANDPLWYADIDIPAETSFEYKYIKKVNGQVVWESDPNRRFVTSKGCGSTTTINDTWR
jgi:glucoamylase